MEEASSREYRQTESTRECSIAHAEDGMDVALRGRMAASRATLKLYIYSEQRRRNALDLDGEPPRTTENQNQIQQHLKL